MEKFDTLAGINIMIEQIMKENGAYSRLDDGTQYGSNTNESTGGYGRAHVAYQMLNGLQ